VSPHDSIGLLRIINTPARGIGRTTIEQIEQYALQHELSLWSALERMLPEHAFSARAEAALAAFQRMITELASQVETRPLSESLTDLLERTGYRKMLEEEGTEDARTRMGNLDELINAAADASERGESIRDFLDHAALVADSDSLDERAPVSLLTMHNAKGLEFPVVFIAGLEEGLFPHSRSLDSESAMEEERRLCYVGMTRAEQRLYLSWARYRRRFGGGAPEQSIASRFLQEVPRALVDAVRSEPARGYGMDLYAERREVRETARKNLYTGKTYNSVDSIRQFFDSSGQPVAQTAPPVKPGFQQPPRPPAAGAGPVAGTPPMAKKARKFGPGSTVEHAKYGRGTVLRLEGTGDDTKITVSFPGYGLKKLIAKYAGIKVE
jgi:DNA helicase-2/ATP-dependent DNA helicase PcrA